MIYAAERVADGVIKIGYTTAPFDRVRGLASAGDFVLMAVWEGGRSEEYYAHAALERWNINPPPSKGPWRGQREFFKPSWRVLKYIKDNATLVRPRPRQPMHSDD